MTEPTPAETVTKKKRNLLLPIAGVVIAIAVGGFVASRMGLDKALVKQQVDAFIVQIKEEGRAGGRDINLMYADLEVAGSFTSKHVVMREPVLTIKPLDEGAAAQGSSGKSDALRITTPAIEIYPSVSSTTIKAAQPIDFADLKAPEKSLLKIKSNVPQEVVTSQSKVGEVSFGRIEYRMPSQMDFTYLKEQQAIGGESETPTVVPVYESMIVTAASGGTVIANMAEDESGLGDAAIDLKDVAFSPQIDPSRAVKLAELTGKWSNKLNEKKLNVVAASLKAGPLSSVDPSFPYLPIALSLDASYEGAMPKNAEAVANIQSPESVMVLKHLELTTKDAALKATANFTASAEDSMPVGTANISLTNVPFVLAELSKYGVIDKASEPVIVALLVKITATPAEQLKDAVIPIERARGGVFKIGASTFEELFAVFLQQAIESKRGAMMPSAPNGNAPAADAPAADAPAPSPDKSSELNTPLVPQLPPSNKVKLAPIEVPDPSVRG